LVTLVEPFLLPFCHFEGRDSAFALRALDTLRLLTFIAHLLLFLALKAIRLVVAFLRNSFYSTDACSLLKVLLLLVLPPLSKLEQFIILFLFFTGLVELWLVSES